MKKQVFIGLIAGVVLMTGSVHAMEHREEAGEPIKKAPTWKFLKERDIVEIIAPSAAPLSLDQVEGANEVIKKGGLIPFLPEDAIEFQNSYYNYYSNSDEKRADYFKAALGGTSDGLWVLRGGFGAEAVVERLEQPTSFQPPSQPKVLLGFSDVTAFHLLAATWKWPTLHGPCIGFGQELVSITKSSVNKEVNLCSVIQILKGEVSELSYRFEVIHSGVTSSNSPILGSVLGGNLSIIENNKGTPTELQGRNRFVFFEDTSEDSKRLYRRLIGLKRAGVFKEAKAIIFGNMPISGAENSPDETKKVLNRFVAESLIPAGINIPVIYSARFGHGEYNDVMPFGTKASLEIAGITATLKVSVNESAYD